MFNSRKIPFLGILILLTLHASLRAQPAPIEVRTQTWRVCSRSRRVPIAWDIVDPAYLQLENGQAEGDDATSIRLIDTRVGDGSTSGPLHVIMGSAEESAFFAESEYGVEVTRGEDTFVVRFTSPVSLSGVRLVKTYRFPEKGLNAHLTLKWTNEGDGEVVLADGERGPALTLGPGLGRVPEHEARLAGGLNA